MVTGNAEMYVANVQLCKMTNELNKIISDLGPLHKSNIYEILMGETLSIEGGDNTFRFHAPSKLLKYRAKTFFEKEPETIDWIDNYVEGVFWDIGANIGLYSIYAAKTKNNITVYSFEPSSTNIYTLSKNIILNDCSDKINLMPVALTNKTGFQRLSLQNLVEGNALNAFGVNYDYNGEEFDVDSSYSTYGTTIADLINKFDVPMPNHIKIDVDGIEHYILEGGVDVLDNDSVKTIQIEINEEFIEQKEKILRFMDDHNFELIHKKQGPEFVGSKYQMNFNYLFKKLIL